MNKWKEVALAGLSLASKDDFQEMMNLIGERFVKEKQDYTNALWAYILANNSEKIYETEAYKIN